MISRMATLRVKRGKAKAFEAAFQSLAERVRLEEPGNILFQLHACRDDPALYRVLEVYRDDDDLSMHTESSHVRAAAPTIAQFLTTDPKIELLDIRI